MTTGLEDFKQRQARGFKAAEVKVGDPNIISPDMEFAATHEGKMVQTLDPIQGEEAGMSGQSTTTAAGVVRHTRPDTVVMYKPDQYGHYSPRTVPVTAIKQNLLSGFRAMCPECKGHHGGNPNDCPGREPVAIRRCPVCRKAIFDNLEMNAQGDSGPSDDPNEIRDSSYSASTPASRTKAMLDLHIWAKHPQSARIMNIAPLPEPSESMLEALSGTNA